MANVADARKYLEVAVQNEVKSLNLTAQQMAYRSVNELRNSAIDVLSADGNGRVYGRHRASLPGETPAPDTGNLRRNWRQYVLATTNASSVSITCRIKSDLKYASILEHGRKNMAPRPFSEKIKQAAEPKITEIYGGLR